MAGSFFIENLTEKLAESAWDYFTQIESKGGLHLHLKSKSLWNDILENRAKMVAKMHQRRLKIVGVNDYPNFKSNAKLTETKLGGFRLASDYENLHARIEQAIKNKTIDGSPTVLPVLVGENAAMRSARQNFSANFLASGGFHIAEPVSLENLESHTNKYAIAIFCGDDDDYLKLTKNDIALAASKAKLILIAGLLKNDEEQLKHMGVHAFIHRKSNQFETLESLMSALAINEI
jgi:methylmalonyl-CoA mutase